MSPGPTRSSVDLAIQQPLAGVGLRHDVGEQILKLEDLDTAVDHLGDEVEVVAAGLLQPDDVVEQQFVAVLRREPLMGQSRRADHDSPQPARFRPDAEPGFGRVHRTERLPVAISTAATTDVNATTATTTSSGLVNAGKRLSLRAQRYPRGPDEVEHRRNQQVLPAARIHQPHRVAERDHADDEITGPSVA